MNVDVENGRHRVSVTVHRSQMKRRVPIDIPRRNSTGTVCESVCVCVLSVIFSLLTTRLMNDDPHIKLTKLFSNQPVDLRFN